ncbi:hypothetical protein HPB51_004410 [Rhipicephalus microplus]|uniref:Peptidase M13 N-terminal domain-containing protein n=1 Tax=Rhipicephalus microplus TaxID=6941 RepID=A0A9J6EL19_RHIMP|nr:endothelin-converting enzyme 2-like [Rhipicephalus microplus]KAH8035169.1 hypothetical protein HPB51_004410 [Rhipicephalus microplus]
MLLAKNPLRNFCLTIRPAESTSLSVLTTPKEALTDQQSPSVPSAKTAPSTSDISYARLTPRGERSDGVHKTPLSRRESLREGTLMSLHEERRPIIVGCSMVVVAGFLVVVVVVLVLTSPEKRGPVTCESSACVELNGLLKASIDASVPPCVNFYKHVCGSSFANGHSSVYRQLAQTFGRALVSFSNDDVTASAFGQTPVQKVALFLRTCLLTVAYDKQSEVAEFRRKLKQIGVVWPSFSQAPNVIGTAAKVYATFQVVPLLKIKRSRVRDEGGPYVIVEPDTAIPAWKEKRDGMRISGIYELFYADTIAMYTGQKSVPSSSEFKKFEGLESAVLEKLARSQNGRPDYVYRTVHELELLTPNVKPEVWQTVVTGDLGLSTTAEVRIRDPEYLKRFNDVLGEVEERDLHFYLDWYVLQAMGRFMSASLSKLWYAESWATRDTPVSGEPSSSTPSVSDCLQLTESFLGWSLFQHFATVKVDATVVHKVNAMAGHDQHRTRQETRRRTLGRP